MLYEVSTFIILLLLIFYHEYNLWQTNKLHL